jgi:hypothetical protein
VFRHRNPPSCALRRAIQRPFKTNKPKKKQVFDRGLRRWRG